MTLFTPGASKHPGHPGEPGIQRGGETEFRTQHRFQTHGLLTLEHKSPGRRLPFWPPTWDLSLQSGQGK